MIGFFLRVKSTDWNCHQRKPFYLCEYSCLIGRLVFLLLMRCPFLHFLPICFLLSVRTFGLKWEILCFKLTLQPNNITSKKLTSHKWNKDVLQWYKDKMHHCNKSETRTFKCLMELQKNKKPTATDMERSLKHVGKSKPQNSSYSIIPLMFEREESVCAPMCTCI